MVRLGGAGNKVNRIALNEVDSYVQTRPGLGFWDLCAPETIVRAMGGVCTDCDKGSLKRLSYDEEKQGLGTKIPAFVIGKTSKIHNIVLRRLGRL